MDDGSLLARGSQLPIEQVLAGGAIVLGAYRVERQIGEGGFGRVYEATHLPSGGRVALKIGRRLEHGERLLREARLAAMLESPHAVRVLAVEHFEDGRPVIILEFLEGMSLREYLRQEFRVPPTLAVAWALQLLEVLQEAHLRGLIHRDIKPSNLFLVERGDGTKLLKLLDFGLARALHRASETTVTASDLVVGSPAYMAPEQIRGDAATAQSDIWAFGVVLYEMLAGSRPFQGETNAAVVASIVADPPLPWIEDACAFEPSLRRIVAQCLRKNLDERARSAADVAQGLSDALARADVQSDDTTTSSLSLLVRSGSVDGGGVRRSPHTAGRAVLIVASLVALLGLLMGAVWRPPEPISERVTAVAPRQEPAVHEPLDPAHRPGVVEAPPPMSAGPERARSGASDSASRPAEKAARRGREPAPPPRTRSPTSPASEATTPSDASEKGEQRFFAEPDF